MRRGTYTAVGKMELKMSHPCYFQVQTQMAVSGLQTSDFVRCIDKGTHIVKIDFNEQFWDNNITKLLYFIKVK